MDGLNEGNDNMTQLKCLQSAFSIQFYTQSAFYLRSAVHSFRFPLTELSSRIYWKLAKADDAWHNKWG